MKPWELLDTASLPGSRGELRLLRRDTEYSIRLDGWELMNNRLHGSEEALAELALERLANPAAARVLVGGLGMGFTAAAALARLGPSGRVVVAELVPEVVEWNRGPLAPLAGRPLDDRRVEVRVRDVAEVIRSAAGAWDAILLDVDNGPEGLTVPGNDGLYSKRGLAATARALGPGGVLAVWSAGPGPDGPFRDRLRSAGFTYEEAGVRARKGRGGARHTIWIGARSGGPPGGPPPAAGR